MGRGELRDFTKGSYARLIGLYGDIPYGAPGRSQYPNLRADINRSHLAFSSFGRRESRLIDREADPNSTMSSTSRTRTIGTRFPIT